MPHPYHILIAEDSDAIRGLLARLLVRLYPTVTISAVADGTHALALYHQRGADILIANIHLPILSGSDLVRTLRAQQATLPVLLLSSDSTMAHIALEAGADRFVVKQPSMLQELE